MIGRLYVSDELSIINVTWARKITLLSHSHHTWAVIGIYEGREGNLCGVNAIFDCTFGQKEPHNLIQN